MACAPPSRATSRLRLRSGAGQVLALHRRHQLGKADDVEGYVSSCAGTFPAGADLGIGPALIGSTATHEVHRVRIGGGY